MYLVCLAKAKPRGGCRSSFWEKMPEAFPTCGRANASQLQGRPTAGRAQAHQWWWEHSCDKRFKMEEKLLCKRRWTRWIESIRETALQTHGERSLCWSRFAGRRPSKGPMPEQPAPDVLHPVERTLTAAVCEELQPVRKTHDREVHGQLTPMGWTPPWSRGRVWGGRSVETACNAQMWVHSVYWSKLIDMFAFFFLLEILSHIKIALTSRWSSFDQLTLKTLI